MGFIFLPRARGKLLLPASLTLLLISFTFCVSPELDEEQEAFIEVAGNKIHMKRVGTGQAIVLAHGGYLNLDMWDPQIDEFKKTNTLIRFSDLGHGKSIHSGRKVFGYEIINELIKDSPDQKVILMGLSWGAMLCVDFALNYPQKVEKLILVSPGLNGWEYFQDSIANHHFELRQAAIQRADTLAAARLFHKNWVVGPRRATTGLSKGFLSSSLQLIQHTMSHHWLEDWSRLDPRKAIDRLDQIKVSTYIIIGSEDAEDILLIADEYQKKIPHAEKIVMDSAAHLVNLERPEQFNSILRSILDK